MKEGFKGRLDHLLLATAALAIALAVALFALHFYYGMRAKPPLWSESDLPGLPDPQTNGWALIDREQVKLSRQNLPAAIEDLAARPSWPKALELKQALADFVSDSERMSQFRIVDQAFQMPHFRDACPFDPAADCPVVPWLLLRPALQVRLLQLAVEGDWDSALSGCSHLLRADVDLLSSSRRMLSGASAQLLSLRSVQLFGILLDGLPQQEDARFSKILREVLNTLDLFKVASTVGERAVIGEYVLAVKDLEKLTKYQGASNSWKQYLMRQLLFDRAHTMEMLGTNFQELMEFAKAPATAPIPEEQHFSHQSLFWWIYDPMGKVYVDGVSADQGRRLWGLKDDSKRLTHLRTALMRRLEARLLKSSRGF